MGINISTELTGRTVKTLRAKATYHRDHIAGLSDVEAKEYLLEVVERDLAEAKEGFGRIKDSLPHADRQSAQVLSILWNARPRIKTYGFISQELEYLNGRYPDEPAINGVVKRLRRALEKTDYPIQINNHYGIGYNLSAPDDWQAPWSDE
ncbi:MAG: helix-turn-helix domain-containing protein [Loktanella sp.]|nr:helix-turn-helix domain-containing protein [Loktanella sp.]